MFWCWWSPNLEDNLFIEKCWEILIRSFGHLNSRSDVRANAWNVCSRISQVVKPFIKNWIIVKCNCIVMIGLAAIAYEPVYKQRKNCYWIVFWSILQFWLIVIIWLRSCRKLETFWSWNSISDFLNSHFLTYLHQYFRFDPIPATLDTVCLYVQFLSRTLTPPSIRNNYLSGVKLLHLFMDA